jgi:hypothetical protein
MRYVFFHHTKFINEMRFEAEYVLVLDRYKHTVTERARILTKKIAHFIFSNP